MYAKIICTSINLYCILTACKCISYVSNHKKIGYFTSPNFSQPYPDDINCLLYTFRGGKEEMVQLTFLEFDLQAPYDRRLVAFFFF